MSQRRGGSQEVDVVRCDLVKWRTIDEPPNPSRIQYTRRLSTTTMNLNNFENRPWRTKHIEILIKSKFYKYWT